jgi:peptide/nickel transport system substrate-binding protein
MGIMLLLVALLAVACAGGDAPLVAQAPQQPAPASQPAPAAAASDPLAPKAAAVAAATTPSGSMGGEAMAEGPKYGGTLNYFMRGELRGGFNPHYIGGRRETRTAMGFAYEHLGTWDNLEGQPCTYNLVPWVAKGWDWTDATTLVVSLREGVKFHNKPPVNGREMTADDVVFSLEHHRDGGLQPLLWSNVASMEATDKYTVTFKLKEPSPTFVSEIVSDYRAPVLTREAGGAEDDYTTAKSIIGTGPWVLTKSIPGVGIRFERNPDYWVEGRPYIDQVRLSIMRDPTTRVAALEVGKLDALDELSIGLKDRLLKTSPATQWTDCPGTLT